MPNADEDLLLQFGASERAAGCKHYAGPLALMLEAHLDLHAVVAAGSSVITVGHRLEKIRHY